jgi:putative glutamine amidotransferase
MVDEVLDTVDGLILSAGGDVDPVRYGQDASPEVGGVDRARDVWELALLRAALDRGMPVLGICRGVQLINVAFGGTLVQHLPAVSELGHKDDARPVDDVHVVHVDPRSHLARVMGTTDFVQGRVGVNSMHHQAVDVVGEGLRAAAVAEDGTIEAIESVDGLPVFGVQWHPELLGAHPPQRRLMEWLIDGAAAHGRRRAVASSGNGNGNGVVPTPSDEPLLG